MKKKYIIGSIAAVIISYFLVSKIDVKSSLELLRVFNFQILALCAGVYLCTNILRALRFSTLLDNQTLSFPRMLSVVSIHNLFNQVMPLRTGEWSYPLLLKKAGIGYAKGIASLALARVYDLVSFALFFVIFLGAEILRERPVERLIFFVFAVMLYLILIRYLRAVFAFFFNTAEKAVAFLKMDMTGARFAGMKEKAAALKAEMEAMGGSRDYLRLTTHSMAIWFLTFTMFYLFIRGFDGSVAFTRAVLGSSMAVLTGLLPVNAPGSVGTLEAGWTLGFVVMGVNKEAAFASGLLMHAFVLLFNLVLALVSVFFLRGFKAAR